MRLSLNIENPIVQKILLSLNGRSKSYQSFWFSRHEYDKFWVTENQLRAVIHFLKSEWYIVFQWYESHPQCKFNPRRCMFTATEKFFDLIKTFSQWVEEMNNKIISWCKKQKPLETLRAFGIVVTTCGRLHDKNSNITVNRWTWAITKWGRNEKKYNLYSYLREYLECSHKEMLTNIVW